MVFVKNDLIESDMIKVWSNTLLHLKERFIIIQSF